ncbi:unnamed protein product [Scytosiphon promiscuus]
MGKRTRIGANCMDIQGASTANAADVSAAGRSGSLESAATERKSAEDSSIERKEVEPSSTGPGVGERVDIQA